MDQPGRKFLEAIKATEGDLKPFFDLMAYLFPNEKERKGGAKY